MKSVETQDVGKLYVEMPQDIVGDFCHITIKDSHLSCAETRK